MDFKIGEIATPKPRMTPQSKMFSFPSPLPRCIYPIRKCKAPPKCWECFVLELLTRELLNNCCADWSPPRISFRCKSFRLCSHTFSGIVLSLRLKINKNKTLEKVQNPTNFVILDIYFQIIQM